MAQWIDNNKNSNNCYQQNSDTVVIVAEKRPHKTFVVTVERGCSLLPKVKAGIAPRVEFSQLFRLRILSTWQPTNCSHEPMHIFNCRVRACVRASSQCACHVECTGGKVHSFLLHRKGAIPPFTFGEREHNYSLLTLRHVCISTLRHIVVQGGPKHQQLAINRSSKTCFAMTFFFVMQNCQISTMQKSCSPNATRLGRRNLQTV